MHRSPYPVAQGGFMDSKTAVAMVFAALAAFSLPAYAFSSTAAFEPLERSGAGKGVSRKRECRQSGKDHCDCCFAIHKTTLCDRIRTSMHPILIRLDDASSLKAGNRLFPLWTFFF